MSLIGLRGGGRPFHALAGVASPGVGSWPMTAKEQLRAFVEELSEEEAEVVLRLLLAWRREGKLAADD